MKCNKNKLAIVGVAFRFPGDLIDEVSFWRSLQAGSDLVTQINPERWATDVLQHSKRSEAGRSVTFSAGVLSRIDEFDAGFFGISPREAAWIDPQQRLLLELAWEAMENAGVPASRLAGTDCAAYVGISGLDYGIRALDDLPSFSAHTMTGNTLSIAANRLSYVFDLHGPSMAIDTACSSSLVALHQACNCLQAGDASMALVGGVNLLAHPYPFVGFTKASMLSAGGRCKTFDASGDGYVRAEGGAVLLIKPYEAAISDGDQIHAVILASGSNADGGRKTGLTIPSAEGQIELMRNVLAKAGIAPESVAYLEAHGTGTAIGDPIETSAIGAVYGQTRPVDNPLPIGSVKTNLGHLEPASGMAGLVKALLVLKNRTAPPSIHLCDPNPRIDFDAWRLKPVTESMPLSAPGGAPLVVGVNSFGFGGANAHVLLQEHPSTSVVPHVWQGGELPPLVLSARSEAALKALADCYAEMLQGKQPSAYYDIAYGAAYRRDRLEKRLILQPEGVDQAVRLLRMFAQGEQSSDLVREDAPLEEGGIAFIYAGNGAQWAGMGQLLFAENARFAEIVRDLDQRIRPLAGFSVIDELMADPVNSRVDETGVAQPLLFVIQVAMTTLLREAGLAPAAVTGHSVGEVAAAWAAGALTIDEAVLVICARSAAQARTRGAGRMAAISLAEPEMQSWLASGEWPDVEIAGVNSPQNLTLSGPLVQLEALAAACRSRSIVFRLLDLDYAFHSRAMDPVRDELANALAGFVPTPSRDACFVSSVTGAPNDAALAAAYWWDNVRQPVRFREAIAALLEMGCRTLVEISPHAILQRYLKECVTEKAVKAQVLASLRKNDDGEDRVEQLALRLHLLSSEDTLKAYFPVVAPHVSLPAYPWQRESYWLPHTSEGYRLIERQRVHPLLGWRLKEVQHGWENILDPRTQEWLADHQVGGAVVLPGAAYVEMALAAAREIFGDGTQEIEEIDIVSPVVFDGEHGRSIRFEFNERDGSFQIRSRQRLSEDEWMLNAAGRLLGAVAGYQVQSLAVPIAPEIRIDHATHYRLAASLGLDYGQVFRGLTAACLNEDCLSGGYQLPPDVKEDTANWILHPGILDVCFQSLLDFFQAEIEAGLGLPLLPVKVGRLRWLCQGEIAEFRTCIRRRGLRSVLADFELLDAQGKSLAVLTGCRFRAASLRRTRLTEAACWEIVPVVQPGALESASALLPTVQGLLEQLRTWFVEQESTIRRQSYFDEAQPLFDALVTAFVYEAVQTAGTEAGNTFWQRLESASRDGDETSRLLAWARDLLQEQNWLQQQEGVWQLIDADMPPAEDIWRTLLAEYPASTGELILIGRRGRQLADLLLERIDPSTLAQQLSRSQQLETLYDDALSYLGTRLAVERLLELLASQQAANRRLRVLDCSAGLSELPRVLGHRVATDNIDYVLAHGDNEACDHLQHEYQNDSWITVAGLDHESMSLKAGQPIPRQFDVVLLRHVLGTAIRPDALLALARSRLADGGLLIIAERQSDLATDLVWGISRFSSPASWEMQLARLGFEDVETCREPAGEDSPVGCYLVLGKCETREATEVRSESARWLILSGDDTGKETAEAFAGQLSEQAQLVQHLETGAQLLDRASAGALIESTQREMGALIDHVVFIAPVRHADDVELPVEALNLVLALSTSAKPTKLTLVTRGAVPVDDLVPAPYRHPAHTALWGFGRVVMNEYPGLTCRLIDFPGKHKPVNVAEQLVTECLAPDGENEIVRFEDTRHVLRMQSAQLKETAAQRNAEPRFRLDFRVPGQLRNLLWLAQPERTLAADEIEVRPVATGLNFRDIMYVMGLLPDEAVEHGFAGASLGLEFSGVVTRVGDNVREFTPGDAVMGFGSACFSSHVVTRANALTPKPQAWTFEAAATVPTVFFTVYYALRQLANLQPGERVLIHGGAGGVGIAAIQLARHLGAEVFATAGSEEKRQFVELLGADHVFDSRNLAYADQILACTGGEGVDVVLNSLAGEAIRRNLHVLRPFGRFLELGKRDFFENTPIGLRPFKDNISYFGIDADQLLIARPELAARLFREVMALFDSGALSPLPVRVFPAERVVDAFRYMQQARQIGKVVVTFEGAGLPVQSMAAPVAEIAFDPQAAYLVTGGLSGFGLETARWLARHGAGQILLLSRRGDQTPGASEALASIRALGAEALALACDVADGEALARVLALPGLKPIKGVFHAAMVIDDALISNLDSDRMRQVLIPKVRGGWNLHTLTREMALDHFVLYSSVTTYIGNPGQANYVAANAWLEGLGCMRRAEGLPVTCIGWGPIGDAGYLTRNQEVKDSLASRLGAEPLCVEMALQMLGRALSAPQSNVSIGDFQFNALARLLPSAQGPRFMTLRRQGGDAGGAESLEDFRAMIEGKSQAEVQGIVARLVTQEVAQILAVSPDRVEPARSLHDLGLDSLMGVELALGLEKRFGIQVPAMMLNEGPTVERVTARIMERLFSSVPMEESSDELAVAARNIAAQHGESVSQEEIAAIIREIEPKADGGK